MLIAETEVHVQDKEKVLFSYKEFDHPYTGLMRGTFTQGGGGFYRSSIFPPLSREVAPNINTVRLMGVKYVISVEERITDSNLIYKGECKSEEGPLGKLGLQPEGGTLFIYEVANPRRIAFLADDYRKVPLVDSLKMIYDNKKHPWEDGLVYLEDDPRDQGKVSITQPKDSLDDLPNDAQISKETFNTIDIDISAPKDKYLVLSYLYRPNWNAHIGSSSLKIYRAYGGFMCVKVPAGKHNIRFKYIPYDAYLGLMLTLAAFALPFLIERFF